MQKFNHLSVLVLFFVLLELEADLLCESGALGTDACNEASNIENELELLQTEISTNKRRKTQNVARWWVALDIPVTPKGDHTEQIGTDIGIAMVLLMFAYGIFRYSGLSNACVAGMCAAGGDSFTQYNTMRSDGKFDMRRNCSFFIFAFSWSLVSFTFYQTLAHYVPSKTLSGAVKGALIMEFGLDMPITIPFYISFTDALRGRDFNFILHHVSQEWQPCAVVAFFILGPSAIVNLRFIPLKYRVIWDAVIDMIFAGLFSFLTSSSVDDWILNRVRA